MSRRVVAAITAIVLLALLVLAGWLGALRRVAPPDVVLLTVDTLRVDHVAAFAADSPAATPHLDALAADGVRYTQAFSPISVTGPGFASLLTGLEPASHGVLMNLFRGGDALALEHTTLAEVLSAQRRYATGAFVSGFTLRSSLRLDQGFDRYDAPTAQERRRPGRQTARRAIGWLGGLPSWRWMLLWYHSYDPHGPLTPYTDAAPVGPDWQRDPSKLAHVPRYQRIDGITDPDFYARRYAEAVEYADTQVGRVVAALKQAGRYEHALIVVTADHGETFTERPLWFDHGTHATAEQLHVPLVVKYPRGAHAGGQVDALVSLVDVVPTVAEVLGLEPPEHLDGRVLPLPGQAAADPHRRLLGESSHCKREEVLDCAPHGPAGKELALRSLDRTVLRRSTQQGVLWQVFDRATDPWELGQGSSEVEVEAREVLEAAAADRGARDLLDPGAVGERSGDGGEGDSEELEALRALGYVE